MILNYQIMTGLCGWRREDFFTEPLASFIRGHSLKVAKPRACTRVRRNYFGVRTVNDWNSLPEEIVTSETVNGFKDSLDEFWKDHMHDIP